MLEKNLIPNTTEDYISCFYVSFQLVMSDFPTQIAGRPKRSCWKMPGSQKLPIYLNLVNLNAIYIDTVTCEGCLWLVVEPIQKLRIGYTTNNKHQMPIDTQGIRCQSSLGLCPPFMAIQKRSLFCRKLFKSTISGDLFL